MISPFFIKEKVCSFFFLCFLCELATSRGFFLVINFFFLEKSNGAMFRTTSVFLSNFYL